MRTLTPKLVHKPGNTRSPFTVRYSANGKQRERSFRTERDAEAFRVKVDYETRAHVFVDPDERTTLADYFESWIDLHTVSPSTKALYRSAFANWIKPSLGSKALGKITHDDVRTLLLKTLPGQGRSYESIKTARTVLVAMLGQALRSEKVARNHAAGIKLRIDKSERAEFHHITRGELEALATALGPEWGLSVYLMSGCGLRPGEALGLRHEDVRGDVLRVERQRLRDGSVGPLKARKPGQYRDVPLPAYVAAQIPTGTGELFPAIRGDAYGPRFARAARKARLPEGFHPHALRHAYASALLHAGVSLFEVSRYLGHRSTDFTASVYGHLVPSAASRAREALEAAFAE
jgi:integrase